MSIKSIKDKSVSAGLRLRSLLTVRILLSGLILFYSLSSFSIRPQEAIDRFVQTKGMPAGTMAVLISDLSTGKIIGSYNADLPLIPASIMKAVTIASLSDVVNVDEPWITHVDITGDIDDSGILHGDLVIRGSGDPTINNPSWPSSEDFITEIMTALKEYKITRIEGKIIIDESYFSGESIPSSWAQGDLAHSYGTGSHAFNYRGNARGKSAVKDPAAVFGKELRGALASEGIGIGDSQHGESRPQRILSHHSAEMRDIMRSCMNRSDNLFAETFLRRFGKEKRGDGSTPDAAQIEMEYWENRGADMEGVKIIDGSGLSRANRVTARFMESILREKGNDVEYASFFPLAGQEGTLSKFLADTPLDSYIALKTGSMNGIQCYAGYKLDDDFAPTHAVVIIVNNFNIPRAGLRAEIEKMLLSVFE